MVGANNLGQYTVQQSVGIINETLDLLGALNPGARTFACEVRSLITYLKLNIMRYMYCNANDRIDDIK